MWVLQMDEFASEGHSENKNYSLKKAILREYDDSGNEINPYSSDEAVLMPMDLAHRLIGLYILRYSVLIVTSLALYGVSTVQNQLITQVRASHQPQVIPAMLLSFVCCLAVLLVYVRACLSGFPAVVCIATPSS